MDGVRGGDPMTPAVGCLETTPADGDRSYPDAGDPLFAGRQIHGGASEADLMEHSIIPNNEHIPDAATDPKAHTGLITPPPH